MIRHKQIIVELELSLDERLNHEDEVERLMLVVKNALRDENYLECWRVTEKE